MSAEPETETQNRSKAPEQSSSGETWAEFAMLGLLGAGGAGIWKAVRMTSGLDVLLCLLGSVVAFGAVIYIYFRRR